MNTSNMHIAYRQAFYGKFMMFQPAIIGDFEEKIINMNEFPEGCAHLRIITHFHEILFNFRFFAFNEYMNSRW